MTIDENYVFPLYITKEVIEGIKKICKENVNEVFGYLVGERYIWNKQKYIFLNHYLYIKEAFIANEFSFQESGEKGIVNNIQFEFFKYSEEFDKLKLNQNNKNLLRLGWWHSHPNFGCFLSSVDLTTQRSIFNKSYHVALVVDPIRDEFKFFTLNDQSENGYKEISYAIIK